MSTLNLRLLPGLNLATAEVSKLLSISYDVDENWVVDSLTINDFAYLPSGQDSRANDDFYLKLRGEVLRLAAEAQGLEVFDPSVSSQGMLTDFDALLYGEIRNLIPITLYEASKPEVWAYLTLRVLPDVANWRYPNKANDSTYERHIGAPRNVFRRAWTRVFFANDSSGLLHGLGEDQAVAIFERTAVVSNPKIAESALKALTFIRKVTSKNEIYRDAMVRVRRLASIEMIDALPQSEVDALVLGVFVESLQEISPELVAT